MCISLVSYNLRWLLSSSRSLWILLDFLHKRSYHLQTKTALFLSSQSAQSRFYLFPFLANRTGKAFQDNVEKKAMTCLSTQQPTDIPVFSSLSLLQIKLLSMFIYRTCVDICSISCGRWPRRGMPYWTKRPSHGMRRHREAILVRFVRSSVRVASILFSQV